ncbi:hypothetical protein HPB51_000889 [Rhipicephalus microplus]|uniref:Transposable element n=1 Tax=Rhipicephalus microplus TaxID=6941 RepID=A0A9J6DK55_RHIMP|nr:hypothetical protein HPB51_000889 [Rhipicephalus microplus]
MVVPSVIDSKRRLLESLEGVEGFDSAQRSSSENSTADIFEAVASLLNELYTAQESDNTPIIQLLAEQTTRAFIGICAYCFEELKMSFVLLGKFQTDLLDERFGCYRRLAGSQYHLSVRQDYQCENKLRLQTALPQISTASAIDNDQNQNWEELQTQAAVPGGKFNVVVTQEALSKLKDVIPVVTYVAGYSVHIAVKRLKCDKCRELLTIDKTVAVSPENRMYSLVKEIDRGGLVYPAMPAVNAVAHNYIVVEELSKCAEFLKVQNQRRGHRTNTATAQRRGAFRFRRL